MFPCKFIGISVVLWLVASIVCLHSVGIVVATAGDEQMLEISLEVQVAVNNSITMSYKVEPLPNSYAELGESPHWDVARQSLYYVDIGEGKLLRYDYKQNKVYHSKIVGESLASFLVPIDGTTDRFAVGCARRIVIVQWDGVSETCHVERTLFDVQSDDAKFDGNRFNDGKCDPRGRLFAGTMRFVGDEFVHRYGELYKYEQGGKVAVVKTDVGISNGLAWNEKTNKFYFIDTTDYEVKEYDYDFEKGLTSNPKVVYNFRKNSPKDHLLPDGMTIDADGNIYVATFNGHTIYKINPTTGKLLLEIKFPCRSITSAAFGGPNLDILFVTTSSKMGDPLPAGTTYKVTGLGVKGLPMFNLKL